jgi:hypothetical protein
MTKIVKLLIHAIVSSVSREEKLLGFFSTDKEREEATIFYKKINGFCNFINSFEKYDIALEFIPLNREIYVLWKMGKSDEGENVVSSIVEIFPTYSLADDFLLTITKFIEDEYVIDKFTIDQKLWTEGFG